MRLINLKIRGLGELPETHWIKLRSGVSVFRFSTETAGKRFLQTIQSLNPPFNCHKIQPFRDLSHKTVTPDGYVKAIKPHKRTIALGIFDSPPSLVKELGSITPHLYETDRIEIGRRLYYSRWINFVEIASSSRWSEISDTVKKLLESDHENQSKNEEIYQIVAQLTATDRIKDECARQLAGWLSDCKSSYPDDQHIEAVREKVLRSDFFVEG